MTKEIDLRDKKQDKENIEIKYHKDDYLYTDFDNYPINFFISDGFNEYAAELSSIDNLIAALQELKKHI